MQNSPAMRSTDIRHALQHEPEQLTDALSELHPEDIANSLGEDLSPDEVAQVLQRLPLEQAAEVFERLQDELRVDVMQHWKPARAAELLIEMADDDRVDLVAGLPRELRESVLSELRRTEPRVAEETRVLGSYSPDTAGGLMTTEYLALGTGMTCERAISEVRRIAREQNPEFVNSVYIVDAGKLVGAISLRELILGEPSAPLSIFMTDNLISVGPETDQEEVARIIASYDLLAVPVVDAEGHMLGVVTVDDVVDVVMEEASEDAQKMAGVVPIDRAYFDISFLAFVRSRITWLVVLFIGELLTANVMRHYESQVAAMMDLIVFVPLILSSGGNSGSQSSSLIIRALALGQLGPGDWLRVLWRELAVGFSLGVLLAMVGFLRTVFLGHVADPISMGFVVSCSIISVVTLGTLVGALMPLLIKRLGLDPAVSSTPFVASLVDVFGLVMYFSVSRYLLALTS